ncbi:hypothetical protein DPMN_075038 [Dreissena polymorpha]|uniref:Uncharacterized protein n=1 Tax=Dreissena polymorpha TaxID=45954 RepID=A0A9D3YJL8_DREPO|nr:hypothetical protein DPMN_075038 [Dreissena polymorpha]
MRDADKDVSEKSHCKLEFKCKGDPLTSSFHTRLPIKGTRGPTGRMGEKGAQGEPGIPGTLHYVVVVH